MAQYETDEERALRSTARDVVRKYRRLWVDKNETTDWNEFEAGLWAEMTSLGWPATLVGEAYGGAGCGLNELVIFAEELGRELVPSPFFSSAVLATAALGAAEVPTSVKERVLPLLAAGSHRATIAHAEPASGWQIQRPAVTAEGASGKVVLSGKKSWVTDVMAADFLVVSASDLSSGRAMAYLVDTNSELIQPKPLRTLDLTRPLAEVTFDRVPCDPLGAADTTIMPAIETGTVYLAAEMLGSARWCLETAVEHARNRHQFGRPIGSFQAVKHACARIRVNVELAAEAVAAAVDGFDGARSDELVSLARCQAARAARSAAWTAIQVLGGIGVTMEHDAHLYFRRAYASEMLLGGLGYHRARVAAAIESEHQLEASSGVHRRHASFREAVFVAGSTASDAFEQRVREWLDASYDLWASFPDDDGTKTSESIERARHLQKRLWDAGLAGVSWPVAYGGLGLGKSAERKFAQLAMQYRLPLAPLRIAKNMVAPTILQFGTEEQRRRFLPEILRGQAVWCQLFSEPGAGSDLASVDTWAELVESGWIVNGQKVWSSHAQYADLGLLLARTNRDAPKHHGITVLVLDMHQPNVVVEPIRTMSGEAHFNEVFISDAHVPDTNRIGPVDEGWQIARATLQAERMAIGTRLEPHKHGARVNDLVKLARATGLFDDALVRDRLVEVWLNERCLELLSQRLHKGAGEAGYAGAIAKLVAAELARTSAEAGYEIAGLRAIGWDREDHDSARWSQALLAAPAAGIGGGTNEMMLTAIGERLLGLPREPSVDRSVPFKDLRVGTIAPSSQQDEEGSVRQPSTRFDR